MRLYLLHDDNPSSNTTGKWYGFFLKDNVNRYVVRYNYSTASGMHGHADIQNQPQQDKSAVNNRPGAPLLSTGIVPGDCCRSLTGSIVNDNDSRKAVHAETSIKIQTKVPGNRLADIYHPDIDPQSGPGMLKQHPDSSLTDGRYEAGPGGKVMQAGRKTPAHRMASDQLSSEIQRAQGGGQGLRTDIKSFMELQMGQNFDQVRIHTDGQAVQLSRTLDAAAFTVDKDIFFNEGHFRPDAAQGRHLLAHELVHTVQQEGAVSRKMIQRLTLDEAKSRILDAHGFWGTDEGAIYAAIRNISPADRAILERDPAILSFIRREMSGHDLWKALLLLHFGNEASFPPEIQAIWRATDRWGTDEQAINRALQGLNQAQVLALRAVPGLQDILNSELSGSDLAAANDLLSGAYAGALQNHKANVAFVRSELTNMKAPTRPTIEQNTAVWLDPVPPATPKNRLFVLTPTHDAALRASHHGKAADQRAYFGDTPQFPSDTATYDAQIDSERNIHYSERTVQGEHLEDKIWVHDPVAVGAARMTEVLTHEVQHDADRHNREPGYDSSFKSPEESWNRYKTEFRSYWIDGARSPLSATTGSAPNSLGFGTWDNARQEAIFTHMWGSSASDVYATWLRPNYNDNTQVYGRNFKDLVHGYAQPEGVNLINSPRIDDFFLKLQQCSKRNTDLTQSPLRELETQATGFDANDRSHVNSSQALRLQELMKDRLTPAVLHHIATIINGGTAPPWITVNISEERASFEGAADGWGTDENRIYQTIERATAAERLAMKTDETILRILHQELSGHELTKAQFMLEFGAMANWPSVVTDIWRATDRWGTDEALIRRALEQLSRAQVSAIAQIMGLRDLVRSELSGQDLLTTNELLQGTYSDAIANHEQDINAIQTAIAAGIANPADQPVFARLNDRSKALIYAMTKTHNSPERARVSRHMGQIAYFGARTPYPTLTERYGSLPEENQGIRFAATGVSQQTEGINLYIYDARLAAANLNNILKTFGQALA